MTEIRIGTRGSRLALVQTGMVADALRACLPDARIETVIIKTKGDRILDKPLGEIGDKGLFVSELEAALLEEKVDLAVHSAKDLPMCLAEGLEILAVPQRADARDVLVQVRKKGSEGTGPEGAKEGFASLPPRPVIGTGSKRRELYVREICPQARVGADPGKCGNAPLQAGSGPV